MSGLIEALENMKDSIADMAAQNAASRAPQALRDTIDSLENASTKAEADAVIDSIEGMDETQKAMIKSQIIKQYEDGGETTEKQYITLAYLDMYKQQAISEDKIAQIPQDKVRTYAR